MTGAGRARWGGVGAIEGAVAAPRPWRTGPPRHALPEPPAAGAQHAWPEPPPPGPPRHVLPREPVARLVRGGVDGRVLALGAVAVGLVAVVVALAHPLPPWCVAVAIAIRLFGGGQYALAVARRRARPNVITWFLWGLTPMIAVAAQLTDRPGPEVAVTFVLGLGPLVVAAVGLRTDRSASRPTPFTLACAAASVAAVVAWRLTAVPELAIALCVVADLLATLPTLGKAYRSPRTEYAPPYLLSMLAMLLTVGTVTDGGFVAYGFPLYMLVVNGVLFAFATLPLAPVVRGRRGDLLPPGVPARRFGPGRHATPAGPPATAVAGP